MSISNVRKLIENKAVSVGCFSILFVAFAASFLSQGPGCRQMSAQDQAAAGPAIAEVGDFRATAQDVDRLVSQQRMQMGNQPNGMEPSAQAATYAQAIQSVLDQGYTTILADRNGVAATPDNAAQAFPSMASQELDQAKEALIAQNKLKADAPPEEFAKQYKEMTGKTPDERRKELEGQLQEILDSPAGRSMLLAEISRMNLLQKYSASIQVTDEDLKRSFSTYKLARINFRGADAAQRAQAASDEIKKGASFEQVQAKYNKDAKKEEKNTELPAAILSYLPTYKPLEKLQIGQVSEPIAAPEGPTIFKLTGLTPSLPPDFEKRKDQLRKDLQRQMAMQKLNDDIREVQKSGQVKWNSPAYQALYDYQQTISDGALSPDQRKQKLKEIQDKAAGVVHGDDALGGQVAALAEFAANSALYEPASATEKKAMAQDRIRAIQDVLVTSESPQLRLELSELLMSAGNVAEGATQLRTAAESNHDYTAAGQRIYGDLSSKLEQYKKAKKLSDADAQSIQKELDRWRVEKREQDKMEADAKRQQAEEQKRFEAEAAKAKAAANAKPAPTKK